MPWFIDSDNVVKVKELRDAETETYINDATVTGILYKLPALHPDALNTTVNIGGGLIGILCENHGMSVGDTVRVEHTINYDGEHVLQIGTTLNMIAITASYVVETFTGEEFLYPAIVGTVSSPILFSYVTDSNGDYVGKVPRTAAFFQDERYMMCIKEVSGLEQVLAKIIDTASFQGL